MIPAEMAAPIVSPIAPTPEKPAAKLDKAAPVARPSSPQVVEDAPMLPQTVSRKKVETFREDEAGESVAQDPENLRRAPEQKKLRPGEIADPRSLVKSNTLENAGDQKPQGAAPRKPLSPEVVENPRTVSGAQTRRRVETLSVEQPQDPVAQTSEALRRIPEQKAVEQGDIRELRAVAKSNDSAGSPGDDSLRLPFDPKAKSENSGKSGRPEVLGEGAKEPDATKARMSFEPSEAPQPRKEILKRKSPLQLPALADGLGVKSPSKHEKVEVQVGRNEDEEGAVSMQNGRAPEASPELKRVLSGKKPVKEPEVEESATRAQKSEGATQRQLAALPNSQSFPDITQEDLVESPATSRQPKSWLELQRQLEERRSEEKVALPKTESAIAPAAGDSQVLKQEKREDIAVREQKTDPKALPGGPTEDISGDTPERSLDRAAGPSTPVASQDPQNGFKPGNSSGKDETATSATDVAGKLPKEPTTTDDSNRGSSRGLGKNSIPKPRKIAGPAA